MDGGAALLESVGVQTLHGEGAGVCKSGSAKACLACSDEQIVRNVFVEI